MRYLLFLLTLFPLTLFATITSNSQAIVYPFAFSYTDWVREHLHGDTYYTYLAVGSKVAAEYPNANGNRIITFEIDKATGELLCSSGLHGKVIKRVRIYHTDYPSKPMPLSLELSLSERGLEVKTATRFLTYISHYKGEIPKAFIAFYRKGKETYPLSEEVY